MLEAGGDKTEQKHEKKEKNTLSFACFTFYIRSSQ